MSEGGNAAVQETFYTLAGCPLRIALVADLHERPYGEVLASLRKNRPALICVAGDFLYGSLPESGRRLRGSGMLPFFLACAELAPCFVSLGNHEWLLRPEELALLGQTGATVLDDAFVRRRIGGAELVIGGLSSARCVACRSLCAAGLTMEEATAQTPSRALTTPPRLAWLDGFCAAPGYRILLCHHPEYYPRYLRGRDIDLILSGHAHGGQIRLLGQGLFAPGQGVLPRLTAGVKDGRLVISRGLANFQRVPRLFNPTELVYLLPRP